jgi:branched-chain amino acid transport system permease protein
VIVIVTIGLFLAFGAFAQLFFGVEAKHFQSPFPDDTWSSGDVTLTATTLGRAAVLVAECVGIWVLLQKTKLGLALRAVAANSDSARLVGISAGTILMIGWAIAAALGALAGSVTAAAPESLTAGTMQAVLVFSFSAAALGGFDSPLGAIVGGLIVGVANALTIGYVDALRGIELVVPFALIGLVLLFRPTGLFGRRVVERV